MPVSVQCPACQKQFNVKDEYAGRVGRCTACKATFTMTPTAIKQAVTATKNGGPNGGPNGGAHASAATPTATKTAAIGRFQIRQKLGAGAFGTVYRAYDPQLEREVALKVPQPGVLSTPQRVERFLREAKASAQLTHPAIVPVFDAGTDGGRHYIASKFIEGKPLADAVEDGGLEPQRAARIVAELGDALFYAHMLGVVHRDIKPANVMLDVDDHPHLMDFGLASWENSTEKLTHDGAVLGTPAYMSPEQAAGQQGEAKMESDQYSLGVVLYELLTGRTPFEGPPQIIIHAVINKEPPKPSSIRKGIPRDLETICLKAMAKQPKDRYTNCQEMARDLRRWADGEPIRARRLGIVERATRWARKEPMLASAAGVIALLLVALAGVLTWKVGELTSAVLAEQQQKSAALAAASKAESDLAAEAESHLATQKGAYANRVNLMDSMIGGGRFIPAHAMGANINPDHAGWEFGHLMLATEGIPAAARIFGNRNSVQSLAFNAQSSQVVCACYGGIVQIHDLATGRVVRDFELPGGWQEWQHARFALSGDGERLVALRIAGLQEPMNFAPGMPMQPQNPNTKKLPDEASVWEVRTGKRLIALNAKLSPGRVFLAVNEDGSKIALAIGPKLSLYDGRTGEPLQELDGCTTIKSLTFDRSGETLFAVDGGEISVFEDKAMTKMMEQVEEYTEKQGDMVVKKKRIVMVPATYTVRVDKTVCVPNSIKAWDVATGAAKTPLLSRPTTERIALTCDGAQALLLGTSRKTIARPVSETVIQTVKKKKKVSTPKGEKWVDYDESVAKQLTKYVFEQVGTAGESAGLPIDDVATGQEAAEWKGIAGITSAAFSPDCQRVATVESDHCQNRPVVQLWDAKTHAKLLTLRLPDDAMFLRINWLVWSSDSMHLAGWGGDGRVLVWSAKGGRSLAFRDGLGSISSVAWSPDGKQLAAVSDCTSRGVVFDPATKKLAYDFASVGVSGPLGGGCLGLSFTNDGGQLVRSGIAVGGGHGCYGGAMSSSVLRWDNPAGQLVTAKSLNVLAVNADGTRLVAINTASRMVNDALVSDADGAVICKLSDFNTPAEHVEFSPDGKYLAASSATWGFNGRRAIVQVYNAATGKLIVTHTGAEGVFAFSPDSRYLASATAMVRPMMAPQPAPAPAPPKEAAIQQSPVLLAMLEPGEQPEPAQAKEPQPKEPKKAPAEVSPEKTPSPQPQPAPQPTPQPTPRPTPQPGQPAPPEGVVMPDVQLFNLSTGAAEKTIKGLSLDVRKLRFSPDGKFLAVLSHDLRLVDLATEKDALVASDAAGYFLFAGDRFVYAARPSMGGPVEVMPGPAPGVALGEVSFQEPIGEELAPPGPVCMPGMPPQPSTSLIKFWSVGKRSEVASHFMFGNVTALTVDNAGERVAAATLPGPMIPVMTCMGPAKNDGPPFIHVLSVDGRLAAAIHGHADRVNCLAFDPPGERLATAGEDGAVRVWSVK